jgi:hypothetical protein
MGLLSRPEVKSVNDHEPSKRALADQWIIMGEN